MTSDCSSPVSIARITPSASTGAAIASRMMPASTATGMPTEKRLSCGAERASIAITSWTMISAAPTGSAITSPIENSIAPNSTRSMISRGESIASPGGSAS